MAFGKKKERQTPEYWMALLPPRIREEIEALALTIDDDKVSKDEFIERSMELSQRVKLLPKVQQEAYANVVKLRAEVEREERRAAGEEVPDAPDTSKKR